MNKISIESKTPMKKVYEVSAVVLAGVMIVAATYFILIPTWIDIGNKLMTIYKGTQANVQDSQSPAISKVEEPTTRSTHAEVKASPVPLGKSLSVSPLVPAPNFSGIGNSSGYPILTFGKRNTLVFRDVVTDESIAAIQTKLIRMSQSLPANEPIYLVLETPGGSVDAGLALVDTARGLPQEVKTVTMFAASMGFHIVESLGERLIVPSGTLMSHRIKVEGIGGQVPGEAVTRMNQLLRLAKEMDEAIAKRIGLSLKDYRDLIQDEYWVGGADSVKENLADKVVLGRCGPDMNGTYDQSIMTLFGAMKVTWSECPLITAPLRIDVEELLKRITNSEKRAEVLQFINLYFTNKKEFTLRYILNNDYTKILVK